MTYEGTSNLNLYNVILIYHNVFIRVLEIAHTPNVAGKTYAKNLSLLNKLKLKNTTQFNTSQKIVNCPKNLDLIMA